MPITKGLTSDLIEHIKASIRAKVEHPFRDIKRQSGHVKVRYRGLKKNTAQLHTLFALSNLWMVQRRLLGVGARARLQRAKSAVADGKTAPRAAKHPSKTRVQHQSVQRRLAGIH